MGCNSLLSSKMPSGSVSMAQTYNEAINGTTITDAQDNDAVEGFRKSIGSFSILNYTGYTQTESNQLNSLFPLLPNPNIVMYIYPHFVGPGNDQIPVPGYSTAFPLYLHTQYAMPDDL